MKRPNNSTQSEDYNGLSSEQLGAIRSITEAVEDEILNREDSFELSYGSPGNEDEYNLESTSRNAKMSKGKWIHPSSQGKSINFSSSDESTSYEEDLLTVNPTPTTQRGKKRRKSEGETSSSTKKRKKNSTTTTTYQGNYRKETQTPSSSHHKRISVNQAKERILRLLMEDDEECDEDDPTKCFACMSEDFTYHIDNYEHKISELSNLWYRNVNACDLVYLAKKVSTYYRKNIRIPNNKLVTNVMNTDKLHQEGEVYEMLPDWTPLQVFRHYFSHMKDELSQSIKRIYENDMIMEHIMDNLFVVELPDQNSQQDGENSKPPKPMLNLPYLEMYNKMSSQQRSYFQAISKNGWLTPSSDASKSISLSVSNPIKPSIFNSLPDGRKKAWDYD